ncbi:putative RNA-dependent RNA polymerase [Erysiphe lesion-associated ormycovirus 3]|nr:putative RNA-dependent RNA polymerase [Erysiphe lesion-associated ormycovirus 3]
MFLTQLEPPTQKNVDDLKIILRKFLSKYGPKHVTIPDAKAVMSLSPNLYSDGHVPRRDYEKPSTTWMYSWTYQKFLTGPLTQREVWLPPKAYKICSSWWHFITEPVAKRVPYVICNDTLTQVRKNLHARWKPSVKLDLKGFGLQFPREYIHAFMEIFYEVYPADETAEYKHLFEKLSSIISIKMGEENFLVPKRGVGLGYFTNLMTLIIASILEECDVTMMFSDDMLISKSEYQKARDLLESFGFIINEKKSGQEWLKTPFFAGCCMAPKGSLRFYEAQGQKASLHRQRYHWQRKNSFLSQEWINPVKMAYHYERIFGFEIRRAECFDHPTMLGLNPYTPRHVGYVKGGLLRKYRTPKPDCDENQRRIWAMSFPWKLPVQKKEFQKTRYNLRNEKNRIHYTEYDEYFHPEIESRSKVLLMHPDFMLGSHQLPRWADLQQLIAVGRTCGRVTKGHHPKQAARKMLDYLLADDPISSWLCGGYDVVSSFYRIPDLNPDMQLIYERLRSCIRLNHPIINKAIGEEAISHIKEGDGLEFLQQIKLQEVPDIDDFYMNTDNIKYLDNRDFEEPEDNFALEFEDFDVGMPDAEDDSASSDVEITYDWE